MKYIGSKSYHLRIALAVIIAGLLLFSGVGNSLDKGIENLHTPQVQAADSSSPVELTENRTATSKLFYLGDNPDGRHRYAIDSYIGAIHYQDASGAWQDIDTAYSEADSGLYTAKFTKLPYLARMGNDGTRRIYPDRNDLSYWIDIGKPFTNMPQPTKSGNTWTWNWTNASISVTIANTVVKFDFVLKNNTAPTSITIPFSTQGITRQGNLLYHNGTVVAELRKPFAVDAVGTERDVAVSFGSGSVTISLDPTGLTYPIEIDPTIDVSVGASNGDCHVYWNGTAWVIDIAYTYQRVGYRASTWYKEGGGMLYLLSIPNGATITSANFTVVCAAARPATTVNSIIIGESTDNASVFSTLANYQSRRGTVVGGANDNNITTANVSWNSIPAWTMGTSYTSPDFAIVVQEIINRAGWASGNAMVIFWDDHANNSTNVSDTDRIGASWNNTTYNEPVIHIEYTAGGVSAPTVTSVSSSLVEETTASCTGNITATGGENASQRGIQYGYSTGSYTSNITENDSFGAGLFTDNLTSLAEGATVFWRAFASNSNGLGYGSEDTFHSKPQAPSLLIATGGYQHVDLTWVKGGGSENTTIVAKINVDPVDRTDGTVIYSDTGTSYTHSGLGNGEDWHYGAWAYSINGTLSQYSDSYMTDNATTTTVGVPTVTTQAATLVEETSATLNGTIVDIGGGDNCTAWRFQWGTTSGVYTANYTLPGNYGNGYTFNYNLTLLTEGEAYYFKASANNTEGWGSGIEKKLLTKPDNCVGINLIPGTDNITIEWGVPASADKSLVLAKQGGYPTDHGDPAATIVYFGTSDNTVFIGLDNNETWYISVWAYATEDGMEQYSDTVTQSFTTTLKEAPVVTNGVGATNVTDNDASLNGEITDTGGENPSAWVYWGTADGGTTPASWSDNASLGVKVLGTFYNDRTDNLTPSTLYYYRMRAENSIGEEWADSSANFTTTAYVPVFNPPTNLILTDLGCTTVNASWIKEPTANNTLIRISRTAYPTSITEGEWAYFNIGESCNITGLNLDIMVLYVSAWSELSDNYSTEYAYASIGGTGMESLATSINAIATAMAGVISTIPQFVGIILLIAIAILAFWRHDKILYIISGLLFIVFGFGYWSTSEATSIGCVVVGIIIFIKAFISKKEGAGG